MLVHLRGLVYDLFKSAYAQLKEGQHWITVSNPSSPLHGRAILIDDNTGRVIGGSIPQFMRGRTFEEIAQHAEKDPSSVLTQKERENIAIREGKHIVARYDPERKLLGVKFNVFDHPDSAALRDKLRSGGGRFDPDKKVWTVPYYSLRDFPELARVYAVDDVTKEALKRSAEAASEDIEYEGINRDKRRKAVQASKEHMYETPIKTMRSKHLAKGFPLKLHKFQLKGINWLHTVKQGCLAYGVGLGKTPTSLAAAEALKQEGKVKNPVLIVVPGQRLYAWNREIHDWFKGRTVAIIDGKEAKVFKDGQLVKRVTGPEGRLSAYPQLKGVDYAIMTYGTVRTEAEELKKHLNPELTIWDEAHRLKGFDSQTSVAAHDNLRTEYDWWLTATPMLNRLEESYRAMQFFAPEVLGSFASFKKKYCFTESFMRRVVDRKTGAEKRIPVKDVITGYRDLEGFRQTVAPYFLFKSGDDPDVGIELPPKREETESLDLDFAQAKVYNAIKAGIMAGISGIADDAAAGQNILTELLKLDMVCIDPRLALSEEGVGKYKIPASYVSPKIERVASLVADNMSTGKGTIVFSHYPRAHEFLRDELIKEHGLQETEIAILSGATSKKARDQMEQDFNAGKIRAILMTEAGNEGMNLQGNSNLHIDLDYLWTPALMEQRRGRGYRQGQKNPFTFVQVEMSDTVEQRKVEVLARKRALIGEVFGKQGDDEVRALAKTLTMSDIRQMLEGATTHVDRPAKVEKPAARPKKVAEVVELKPKKKPAAKPKKVAEVVELKPKKKPAAKPPTQGRKPADRAAGD